MHGQLLYTTWSASCLADGAPSHWRTPRPPSAPCAAARPRRRGPVIRGDHLRIRTERWPRTADLGSAALFDVMRTSGEAGSEAARTGMCSERTSWCGCVGGGAPPAAPGAPTPRAVRASGGPPGGPRRPCCAGPAAERAGPPRGGAGCPQPVRPAAGPTSQRRERASLDDGEEATPDRVVDPPPHATRVQAVFFVSFACLLSGPRRARS